jgi:uncharacterized membrane-anchored protein
MSSGRAWLLGIVVAAALGNPCAAIAASPQIDAAIKSLPFAHGGNFTLPISGGTLAVPARYYVLTDESAKTFYKITNGLDAPKGLEAVMLDEGWKSLVLFTAELPGYLSLDDWNTLDAAAILQGVEARAARDNPERKSNGARELTAIGWSQMPELDRAAHVVRLSLNAMAGDKPVLNNQQILLGRYGCEILEWIGGSRASDDGLLITARTSFSFARDGEYADYREGDRKAEYGVSEFLARAIGGKSPAGGGGSIRLAVWSGRIALIVLVSIVGIWRASRRQQIA